jgi:hypothetical protein
MRFYLALCTLFWQPVNYNFTTGESGEEVSSFLNFTSFFYKGARQPNMEINSSTYL